MIKTVIFDMDGVIVDTEPVHHFAYNQYFKQLGIEVFAEMFSEIHSEASTRESGLRLFANCDIDSVAGKLREITMKQKISDRSNLGYFLAKVSAS